jgi:hypothetical protein
VRQLGRAAAAGALQCERVLVVDRDPACIVAREPAERLEPRGSPAAGQALPQLVVSDWGAFLDTWIPVPERGAPDAIVPSPLMPHLFFEYLARRVSTRWPGRAVNRAPLPAAVGTPWERAAPDGTSYVSHATWTCPINCIEPDLCPHTRDVRDWSMPATLNQWLERRRPAGDATLGPFTFHCTHRAFGVGMVDKRAIRDAERAIDDAAEHGEVQALVATASHCHGAAALLAIGPVS